MRLRLYAVPPRDSRQLDSETGEREGECGREREGTKEMMFIQQQQLFGDSRRHEL